MSLCNHKSHTSRCNGPVPSHKKDAVIVIDFMAKPEVPMFVENICGKETVLDTSNPSLQFDDSGTKYFACPIDENDIREGGSDESFSSQKVNLLSCKSILLQRTQFLWSWQHGLVVMCKILDWHNLGSNPA